VSTPLIVALAVVAGVVGMAAVATVAPASEPPGVAATTTPGRPSPSEPSATPTPAPTPIIGPVDSLPAAGPIDPSWCTHDQVMLSVVAGDAATGHRAAGYRATNVSDRPCVLDGYPDVAIADPLGADVGVAIVHGGSFMTQDPGPTAMTLPPGGTAMSLLGWDASDGRTAIGAVYIAAYPGLVRTVIPADWDMTAATTVAVTAWGPDLGSFQE
jgi:hypothetical protein